MTKHLSDYFFFPRQVPTREQLNELIKSVETLFQLLQEKVDNKLLPENAIANLKKVFQNHKKGLEYSADGVKGKSDGMVWDDIAGDEKKDIYWEINMVRRGLLELRAPDLRFGFKFLVFWLVVFILSLAWYMQHHWRHFEDGSNTTVLMSIKKARIQMVSMEEILKNIDDNQDEAKWQEAFKKYDELEKGLLDLKFAYSPEQRLGVLSANLQMQNKDAARQTMEGLQEDFAKIASFNEQVDARRNIKLHRLFVTLKPKLEKVKTAPEDAKRQKEDAWNGVSTTFQEFVNILIYLPIRYDTEKQLGRLEAAIKDKNINEVEKEIQELSPYFEADMLNLKEGFFYSRNPMKWLEIVSWAFFGVLVGIIFYLGKQLKNGMFDRLDVPAIIGEIIMAPIVTCVVFFLFNLTGIATFSPTKGSIIVVMGVAFIFGYAIRRTVGLLENIKQRLLPNP